jgi:hypothetical protein
MGGIAAKQQQIDEYKAAEQAERPKMQQPYEAAPSDHINPNAKYGDKPGEVRPTREMQVFDDSGVVQPEKNDQEKAADDAAAKDAAMRQAVQEVHMEEAPLGHGSQDPGSERSRANAPLGGQMDTEAPKPDVPIGARMNTDNYVGSEPPTSMKNAPEHAAGEVRPMVREASAQKHSAGTPMPVIETPRPNKMSSPGTTDQPSDEAAALEQQRRVGPEDPSRLPAISPEHRAVSPEMKQVDDDAMAAMKSGDLVKLGMANINARMLKSYEDGKQPATPTPAAPTPEQNLMNQRAELKHKMINAPSEQERFQAEKDLAELNRRSPWGSEGNHPGVMGKIGHVMSRVGQAALMPTAPYLAPAIPGSQAQLAGQEARGEQGVEAAQKKQQQTAVTKEAEQQPALREEAQKLAAQKMENTLRVAGYKTNPLTGEHVPLTYEEMSPQLQAKADRDESIQTLNEAKGHEQEAKAVLERYKADPNNAQNKAALQKLQLEGQKIAIAAGNLGIHQKEFLRDTYGVDEKGNPIPGVETTEAGQPVGLKVSKGTEAGQTLQTKGVQARNVQDNLNAAIDLIQKNPDLFGKVSGRFTSTRDMVGTDDPAIDRLGNLIHNAALASTSVHGLRGEVAVEATEKELLNHFKNSPEATIAGMQDTINSMGTFTSAATKGAKKTIEAPTKPKTGERHADVPPNALSQYRDKEGNVKGYKDANGNYVSLTK